MPNWLGGLSGGLTALGNEIGGGSGGAGQAGGANGQSQPYQPLKQMNPFKAIGKGFGQYITNRQRRGALGAGSGSDMGSNDPNPGGPSDWANVDDDEMGTPGMARGGEVGIAGTRPQIAEAAMRRYSPIGPRNPQVMLQPNPQGMAHRLPRREAIAPRLNVRLPRPHIPGR